MTDRHHQAEAASEIPPLSAPSLDDLQDEAVWLTWRDTAIQPLDATELVTTEQTRAELIAGARLLNVSTLHAHQLLIADALNAGQEVGAVLAPRQIGKTKTLVMLILGRCLLRPKYNAAFSITTLASKSSEVFTQTVMDELETLYPDPETRPVRIYKGKGSEHIKFPNGSRFSQKTAKGASFRASSYSCVWIDESGEATPEQAKDLLDAILSTFDTTDGQLILTGTAGTFRRSQLLYEALGNADNAHVRYAIPEDTTPDELEAWEPSEDAPFARARELTLAMHPGIQSGLTTEEKVRRRFVAQGPERFGREYLGIFGTIGEGLGPINVQSWIDAGNDAVPDRPEHVTLAAATSFPGKHGSIVCVWRDESGRAHIYLIDHRNGTTWLADAAARKSREYGVPVIFDKKSNTMRAEAEVMARMEPTPDLREQGFDDVTSAAALLVKEINQGNVVHYKQSPLDTAAKIAVRRKTGPASWAFGPPPKEYDSADISALEAAALALRYYDENPAVESFGPILAA
ncbi:hypothetical protein [Microbacterium sp. SLBN-146]|uniref:hypothetical protein n=1 Tax=Microbacterium sp. SLBN-146 TaxID=2768457 RepID=UPI001153D33B|nr:hypothetical protein [Microbacterium sp. SLBN-146]